MFVAQVDDFKPEKGYGWLRTPRGLVHIHINNARRIVAGASVPVFTRTPMSEMPVEGTWIAFDTVRQNKRNQWFAARWGLDEERRLAELELDRAGIRVLLTHALMPDWE